MTLWDSDSTFGFEGAAAGGNLGTATTPATPATAKLAPASAGGNPFAALIDPRGSAVFWIALAAVLGLAMVSGQLKVSAALKARGGK